MPALLRTVADEISRYRAGLATGRVPADHDLNAARAALDVPLGAAGRAPEAVVAQLLGIPGGASVGFVTGAQAANTVGLAAGRHHVLAEAGWDVERRGLLGAPRARMLASQERHATVDRSLRLLGLGTDLVEPVATDSDGAIDVADLKRVLAASPAGPTIVCLQAGNVNTGACDDLRAASEAVHRHGGWVHVDGAFGLWAGASRALRHLVDGWNWPIPGAATPTSG